VIVDRKASRVVDGDEEKRQCLHIFDDKRMHITHDKSSRELNEKVRLERAAPTDVMHVCTSLKRRVSIGCHRERKRRTYLCGRCSAFTHWYSPRLELRDTPLPREHDVRALGKLVARG
jgi:hypothetical protein